MIQHSVEVEGVSNDVAGTWRMYARRPGHAPVEISWVRGVPTKVGPVGFADPFGAQSLTLTFPKITIWDAIGVGELEWLDEGADVDLVWDGGYPAGYLTAWGAFAWEGLMSSFDYSTNGGLTVSLVGAAYQLDTGLAKPEYPSRPIPYEYAIQHQFNRPDSRMHPLKVEWPAWWPTVYASPPKGTREYLIPIGVRDGDKWTGLTTRQTGAWEQTLTSYVQTLLSSMYTERGRWTIDLDRFRKPVLRHRDIRSVSASDVVVVDPANPGVDVNLTVDWTQSTNVIYGQGQSLAGEGYTGQIISPDGQRTSYEPLAALRQAHPTTDRNGWFQPSRIRREVLLQLQAGLTLSQARRVAQSHLQRFSEPGVTGTITLTTDPRYGLGWLPRALVKAGMTVQLVNAFGRQRGVMLHISSSTFDPEAGTVTLSVDSKYRDALTVEEVKLRGRDSLSVSRQLIGGQYTPPVPDLVMPWNYAEGSGFIPSGPHFSSQRLFEDMDDDIPFPWTEVTTARPPSDPSWEHCYIKITPKSTNADNNWGYIHDRSGLRAAFPVKLAQAGSIRMVQLAAYTADGDLFPVKFHVSFYASNGVGVTNMPRITAADAATADGYAAGQHYPFFAGAWERYKLDGTQINTEDPIAVSSSGLIRGYGTRMVPAGYWPGSSSSGDPKTGQLVDEQPFEFDLAAVEGGVNTYQVEQTQSMAGYVWCMIYCDDQGTEPIYFAGRMFRTEPGATV